MSTDTSKTASAQTPSSGSSPGVSIVLPTFNERENIVILVQRLLDILANEEPEIIVVDDGSPDGTASVVRELSATDPRVRLIERAGKAGLSGAVMAGAASALAPWVGVMDADLSHDPEELPSMLALARRGNDVVIGSRYVSGSRFVGQPLVRRIISRLMNTFARAIFLLRTQDVLTGYAVCNREVLTGMPTRHSAGGFKWLIELLATGKDLRVAEWPILFRDRRAGSSKATAREALTFLVLCARLAVWRTRRLVRLA